MGCVLLRCGRSSLNSAGGGACTGEALAPCPIRQALKRSTMSGQGCVCWVEHSRLSPLGVIFCLVCGGVRHDGSCYKAHCQFTVTTHTGASAPFTPPRHVPAACIPQPFSLPPSKCRFCLLQPGTRGRTRRACPPPCPSTSSAAAAASRASGSTTFSPGRSGVLPVPTPHQPQHTIGGCHCHSTTTPPKKAMRQPGARRLARTAFPKGGAFNAWPKMQPTTVPTRLIEPAL